MNKNTESLNKYTIIEFIDNKNIIVIETEEEIFNIIWGNISNNFKFIRLTQIIFKGTDNFGITEEERSISINIDHITKFYIKK